MLAGESEARMSEGMRRLRVAVLLSGSGRTLENLVRLRDLGKLEIDLSIVIASREGVRGLEVAADEGIAAHVVSRKAYPTPAVMSARIAEVLTPHDIDLILLAGYLSQLQILPEWEGRMMNIHPSLLPLFGGKGLYGSRVHDAVLASGMKVSGCTVHLVNADYDGGPIVLQRCVPVLDDDTAASLGARVFAAECEAYPEAIRLFAQRRLVVEGKRVRVVT